MDPNPASGNNSPGLAARPFAYDAVSDEEDEHRNQSDRDDEFSEGSFEGRSNARDDMEHDQDMTEGQEASGEATSASQAKEGMLPRDYQRKTAYYDYAAEKQLSQADMKLFYQRSQLDAQRAGGSQHSPQGSPIIRSRTVSHMELDQQQTSGSLHSVNSGIHMAQR